MIIKKQKIITRFNTKLIVCGFAALGVGVFIFVLSWPYLWADPVTRIQDVMSFYKGIGISNSVDSRFTSIFGINTYPILWILFSTSPFVLLTVTAGLIYAVYLVKNKKDLNIFLILLWLVVPISRVSFPHTHIYGGIRQIMEFVPPLAIVSGIGGAFFIHRFKKLNIRLLGIVLTLVFIMLPTLRSFPNENTYFNFLIGGLSGAKAQNFPSWGNSFGAAYRQGINFLNQNAKENSVVVLASELTPNIPLIWLRSDLVLNNRERSGPDKKGEYAITLTYQGTQNRSFYDAYLENILEPIYEVKNDDTGILKVWKNDIKHTRKEFLNEEEVKDFEIKKINDGFQFNFEAVHNLSKVIVNFNNKSCKNLQTAYSEISIDDINWIRLPGVMPREDWNTSAFGEQPQKDSFTQPFAGDEAKYIRYTVFPKEACISNIGLIKIYAYR